MLNPSSKISTEEETIYANRHIPTFLSLARRLQSSDAQAQERRLLQVVHDGRLLTAANFINQKLSIHRPLLVQDKPESFGMRLPLSHCHRKHPTNQRLNEYPNNGRLALTQEQHSTTSRKITVRDIADLVGHDSPVHVIDVEHQEEMAGWCFGDLVDYFEDKERLASFGRCDSAISVAERGSIMDNGVSEAIPYDRNDDGMLYSLSRHHLRRKAAAHFLKKTRHRVLNQITYEFSHVPALAEQVRSPAFVRHLDWIDHVWPKSRRAEGDYPAVQYYCLTSGAGSYTDFHIDFGGTSVWYHVLSGSKIFCLIAPTESNLQMYEDWIMMKDQAHVFLPDIITDPNQIVTLTLHENETMIIPSAWIHAVYTPDDALVLGGNFMHGFDIRLQLRAHAIEERSRLPNQFRFPQFVALQFYAAGSYLRRLRVSPKTKEMVASRELEELPALIDALADWWKHGLTAQAPRLSFVDAGEDSAVKCGCSSVDEMLEQLRIEHQKWVKEFIMRGVEYSQPIAFLYDPSMLLNDWSECANRAEETESIQIELSTNSKRVLPLPPELCSTSQRDLRRSGPREDMATVVDNGHDDDWKPMTKRSRVSSPANSNQKAPRSPSEPMKSSIRSRQSKTTRTTARQRLLKKVG